MKEPQYVPPPKTLVHYSLRGYADKEKSRFLTRQVLKFPETTAEARRVVEDLALSHVTSEEDLEIWLYPDAEPKTVAKWYAAVTIEYTPEIDSVTVEEVKEDVEEEEKDEYSLEPDPRPPDAPGQQSLFG